MTENKRKSAAYNRGIIIAILAILLSTSPSYAKHLTDKESLSLHCQYSSVLDISTRFSKARIIHELTYMHPITSYKSNLSIFDTKLKHDNYNTQEINIGIANRINIREELILGLYVYGDYKRRLNGLSVKAITTGLEILSYWIDLRLNAYIPEQNKRQKTSQGMKVLKPDGAFIVALTSDGKYEYALNGYDVEVGFPLFGFSRKVDDRMGTRFFIAHYNFNHPKTPSIIGSRLRFEHIIKSIPWKTHQVEFKLQGELQYDDVRGRQDYIGLSANINFNKSEINKYNKRFSVSNRMMDTIIRDVDIVFHQADENVQRQPLFTRDGIELKTLEELLMQRDNNQKLELKTRDGKDFYLDIQNDKDQEVISINQIEDSSYLKNTIQTSNTTPKNGIVNTLKVKLSDREKTIYALQQELVKKNQLLVNVNRSTNQQLQNEIKKQDDLISSLMKRINSSTNNQPKYSLVNKSVQTSNFSASKVVQTVLDNKHSQDKQTLTQGVQSDAKIVKDSGSQYMLTSNDQGVQSDAKTVQDSGSQYMLTSNDQGVQSDTTIVKDSVELTNNSTQVHNDTMEQESQTLEKKSQEQKNAQAQTEVVLKPAYRSKEVQAVPYKDTKKIQAVPYQDTKKIQAVAAIQDQASQYVPPRPPSPPPLIAPKFIPDTLKYNNKSFNSPVKTTSRPINRSFSEKKPITSHVVNGQCVYCESIVNPDDVIINSQSKASEFIAHKVKDNGMSEETVLKQYIKDGTLPKEYISPFIKQKYQNFDEYFSYQDEQAFYADTQNTAKPYHLFRTPNYIKSETNKEKNLISLIDNYKKEEILNKIQEEKTNDQKSYYINKQTNQKMESTFTPTENLVSSIPTLMNGSGHQPYVKNRAPILKDIYPAVFPNQSLRF